jgi:hypothetical protein
VEQLGAGSVSSMWCHLVLLNVKNLWRSPKVAWRFRRMATISG